MKQTFLALFCLVLLVSRSEQLGTLYLNQILANSDTPNTVQIETVTITSSTVYVDTILPLFVSISIGNIVLSDGTISTPQGLLLVDDGAQVGSLSVVGQLNLYDTEFNDVFTVDSSGDLFTVGGAEISQGINIQNGAVTITNNGQTTIATALLKPNGGLIVGDGVFSVDPSTGDVSISGPLTIGQSLFLGSPLAEDIYIARTDSTSGVGGDTHITGQLGLNVGGDVYLEPGISQNTPISSGEIIFGRNEPDNLVVGRVTLTSLYANAGATYLVGQSTSNGNGGDFIVSAGNSAFAAGGDLLLVPGVSTAAAQQSTIYVGQYQGNNINAQLLIGRPTSFNSGTPTTISGQNTVSGPGGDLILAAGNTTTGNGGNLYLVPGASYSFDTSRSYVILNTDDSQELLVSRVPTDETLGPLAGGATYFYGQSSYAGPGGLLALYAGDASVNDENGNADGGNLYLLHGASAGTTPAIGYINLGNPANSNLQLVRYPTNGNGNALSLTSQDSSTNVGGDLTIIGGIGVNNGGSVQISNGAGATGGSAYIEAGDGAVQGGSVTIQAGLSVASPGNVYIGAGSGQILLAGGSSALTPGAINVESVTSQLNFNVNSFQISAGTLTISRSGSSEQVVFTADPQQLLSVNGQTILKQPQGNVAVVTDVRTDMSENIARLQDSLMTLLNALGPCGHGLISFGEQVGLPVNDCIVPSPLIPSSS